jgi:transposase
VAAVDGGMSQIEAARVFGVSRRAVGVWVRAHRVAGEASLRPNRRGRTPGEQFALPVPEQARLLRIMADGPPDTAGLEHALWSRRAVAALIQRELGLGLSPVTVGQYLARWGLGAPASAVGGHPGVVVGSLEGGRRRGQEPMWARWTRLPPEATAARLVRMAAPGVEAPEARADTGLEVLMARSARGTAAFLLGRRPYRPVDVLDFGERLVRHAGGGVHLVVCGWPAEHLAVLRGWRDVVPAQVPLRVTVF